MDSLLAYACKTHIDNKAAGETVQFVEAKARCSILILGHRLGENTDLIMKYWQI